jgi:hypothetical protein
MRVGEFVRAVKIQTSDAAVEGTLRCLTKPPGRKTSEHLVRLSEWYNQLDGRDQGMLGAAIREAAEMAVFEFFCVLDGVSVIEDTPEKGELEFHYTRGAERLYLNDPHGEELHNLFNGLCREGSQASNKFPDLSPYDSGEAQELKSKMISGDNLDMHHVPDKYASMQGMKGYDPRTGPAIVLPKVEHRQIPPQ